MRLKKFKYRPLKPEHKRLLQAAWNMYRQGLLLDAETLCYELLADCPAAAEGLHLAGTLALQQGRVKEAINLLKRSIKVDNNNAECYANLGLAYHEHGQIGDAVNCYITATKLMPNYADAYYNLHAALLKPDNISHSIECLKKAVTLNQTDAEAIFMLGVLADYQGDEDIALTYFDKLPGSAIYKARLDAWNYLKLHDIRAKPIFGSAIYVFQYAMQQAKQEGLILEFGVRFGNSISMISAMAGQEIHGFDSFEGLPAEWHHEAKGSYSTQGKIPEVPDNVQLHPGWFENTLPTFLASHEGSVRFINVDCDMYSSTNTVLTLLAPRIVVGSVIVFDEYIGNEHWREDEYKAFQEAVSKYGWEYEYLCFSFFTKQVAVKITKV